MIFDLVKSILGIFENFTDKEIEIFSKESNARKIRAFLSELLEPTELSTESFAKVIRQRISECELFDFNWRIKKFMPLVGVVTIGDLISLSRKDVVAIRGIGEKTLAALEVELARCSLKLGTEIEAFSTTREFLNIDIHSIDDFTNSQKLLLERWGIKKVIDMICPTDENVMFTMDSELQGWAQKTRASHGLPGELGYIYRKGDSPYTKLSEPDHQSLDLIRSE